MFQIHAHLEQDEEPKSALNSTYLEKLSERMVLKGKYNEYNDDVLYVLDRELVKIKRHLTDFFSTLRKTVSIEKKNCACTC